MGRAVLLPCLLLGLVHVAVGPASAAFESHRAGFTVEVGEESADYDVLAFSVLPGEVVPLRVPPAVGGAHFEIVASDGEAPVRDDSKGSPRAWTWTAPNKPGVATLVVRSVPDGRSMRLVFLVLTPASQVQNGSLKGYRIGAYPEPPLRGNPIYRPPLGFFEVTTANQDTQVSPHFRLRQFLCKQAGGHPKYVLVGTRLLRKLEHGLEELNQKGVHAETFFVMSGFRTPVYNTALRDVPYSRHQWGDAADVYVDQDRDGRMDDINRDGKSDDADSAFLYDFFDGLAKSKSYAPFEGGLGRYGQTRTHPPFVHVDARGSRARWSG